MLTKYSRKARILAGNFMLSMFNFSLDSWETKRKDLAMPLMIQPQRLGLMSMAMLIK